MPGISISRQCRLLGLPRSTRYYQPEPPCTERLALAQVIDEIFTEHPFYGKRSIRYELRNRGYSIGLKKVRNIMCELGLASCMPKPNTSKPHPEHRIYPYLLRNVPILRSNQVWASDITYIRVKGGFAYLVVIMDWYTRKILSWRLSSTLDAGFCVEALKEALTKYPQPNIFNTDQGGQFTSRAFTSILENRGIRISMDGRGRWMDNVMVERFWRTIKYENVYICGYSTIREAWTGIGKYIDWYNHQRPHQTLQMRTPEEVYLSTQSMENAA